MTNSVTLGRRQKHTKFKFIITRENKKGEYQYEQEDHDRGREKSESERVPPETLFD